MRKIFLAGIFVFCLIAGSAMVSADWFGSAFNRNITGFAVLDGGAASSGADSNAAKAAEISAKAAQVKNLLQKQREAKAIRKKAYEEERQKAKEAKKEKSEKVPCKKEAQKLYVLFSRSGFSRELIELAEKEKGLVLYHFNG